MSHTRSRPTRFAALAVAGVSASLLLAGTAAALVGGSVTAGEHSYAARLTIGPEDTARSCTATLIDQNWVATAASCFAATPGDTVPAGKPQQSATVTFNSGQVATITDLKPRADRDLVLARLDKPITAITPADLATTAPTADTEVSSAGYGYTQTLWGLGVSKPNKAAFKVTAVNTATVDIVGKSANDAICKGDTGAPILNAAGGFVAVASRSWQGGCIGESETRTNAITARTDDVAGWIQQITSRDLLPRSKWANADLMASGYFTGGSANGTRHMDLVVRWTDGSVSLFQGADHNDPKYPFAAEHKVAAPNSVWRYARALTAGSFAATGTDGLVVRWSDGELTEFAHVDAAGFHDEKTHRPANTVAWQSAKLITAGRYTANPLRDDLLVVWNDGKVSLYADIDTNGVTKESVLSKANTTWPHAEQISAGAFTGKATNDLMVRWADGETTIYPGVDTAGFHGEIKIRDPKSPWLNAKILTVGAFVGNKSAQDVLVRWTDGKLSLFPAVDAAGLHTEVKLVG
ncbi:S1 family peptidase [Streptomyces sp. NPDC002039]|uniref:S1 family peptidase n=1 Tax=Streptomyces sp. NPDC002039 TaxID=3154660 RepID=UPI0033239149